MSPIAQTNDDSTVAGLPAIQPLAKRTAHSGLYRRLVEEGLDEAAAAAVSRAVVDPADARRRLDRPVEVRVPGGRFLALDTHVWSPALVGYAVNNRAASARRFPAGGLPRGDETARFRPMRPATDAADESARLELRAESPEHLTWSLERSTKFLLDHNNLTRSIAAQGVMVAVTAVVVRCVFVDGSDPVTVLTTADGSSRTTGAHEVLGLTPQEVVFTLPQDERAFRGMLADALKVLDRPAGDVAEEEVERLRALQLPARVLLRYEPDEIAPVGFARAVDSLVHLVHVEPPKPWDEAASLDAKADSVVAALHEARLVTPQKRAYLDGMLTPDEARERSLPGEADERALWIVQLLSKEKAPMVRAVRAGVLEVAHAQKQVRKEEKARIAVELSLRSERSELPAANLKSARGALKDAYLMPRLWGREIGPRGDGPEDLRDAALAELAKDGSGRACVRLAAHGAFWLAVHRVLREAHFFERERERRDGRSPQRVLEALMASRHGVMVLHRAILDGRDGEAPVQVDSEGKRLKNPAGQLLPMSHEWLRGEVVPLHSPSGDAGGDGNIELPTRLLMNKIESLRRVVGRLEDTHRELREVRDLGGAVLVDQEGINEQTVDDLSGRLDRLRTKLAVYAEKWRERYVAEDADDALGETDDDTEALAEAEA